MENIETAWERTDALQKKTQQKCSQIFKTKLWKKDLAFPRRSDTKCGMKYSALTPLAPSPKSERLERVKKDQTYNLFLYKKPQISYQFDRENVTDFRQSDGSASLSSLTRVTTSQSLVLKSVLRSSITLPCYQFFYIISTNRVPANMADKNDKKKKKKRACIIALRNKTVAHIFLPSFDNANGHLCEDDCWDPGIC